LPCWLPSNSSVVLDPSNCLLPVGLDIVKEVVFVGAQGEEGVVDDWVAYWTHLKVGVEVE